MKRPSRKLVIPAIVLVVSAIGSFLLVATAPSVENVEPDRAIPVVRTIEAQPESVRLTVRTQGTVAPRTESALIPEVSGRVVWVSPALVSGGFFESGETLLRIDPRDHEMAVERQRAALLRAEGDREYADSELARQRGLSERQVASTARLSEARRAGTAAEAAVTDARVALEQAKRDLARTEIVAPFEGRVRVENVDVGQFVSRGTSVATLYATDYAEIRLPVADHQLAYLQLSSLARRKRERWAERAPVRSLRGRPPRVDRPCRPHRGRDRRAQPHGERRGPRRGPLSHGRRGRGEAAAGGGAVRAGGDRRPPRREVIVVPRYAMRDASRILIVDAEDRLHTREVEVLRFDRDDVLIRSQLARVSAFVCLRCRSWSRACR